MSNDLIVVNNLALWRKAVKELDTGLDAEVKVGLKSIGTKVATKAGLVAQSKGLRKSGDLIQKIKPSVTQKGVAVIEKATRKASPGNRPRNGGRSRYAGMEFAYPSIYEYGGRVNGGATGPRAFLQPALEGSISMIQQELSKVIEKTASKAGFH
jgi:hypothetical protein